MKRIKLTQGQYTLVDDTDYDWLSKWKWYAYKHRSGNFYAVRQPSRKDGKRHQISMSRQILGLEKGDRREGDHRNHSTLDNQRNNLRICTHQQNIMNEKSQRSTSGNFKGVSWNTHAKKWRS